MKESDYKRKLVAEVNATLGGHARRVEDRWAVGVLDLIIKLPRLPLIMAEGKVVEGNLFGPTPAQLMEGWKWIGSGVEAVLLGWKSGQLYVSPWTKQADIRVGCFTRPGGKYSDVLCEYIKGITQ